MTTALDRHERLHAVLSQRELLPYTFAASPDLPRAFFPSLLHAAISPFPISLPLSERVPSLEWLARIGSSPCVHVPDGETWPSVPCSSFYEPHIPAEFDRPCCHPLQTVPLF